MSRKPLRTLSELREVSAGIELGQWFGGHRRGTITRLPVERSLSSMDILTSEIVVEYCDGRPENEALPEKVTIWNFDNRTGLEYRA